MNDLLQFLNTASMESLTKIPGISQSLAESLIAARPFNSPDDCLNVRGMGKNLLARVQSAFESIEPEVEVKETAMLPIEEKELMPIEKSQPVAEPTPEPEKKPSFSSRLGQVLLNVLRAFLRLVLLAMLIVGFGALIYYGAPYLRDKFIAPVEQNAARVSELENEITTLQTQLTEINNQLTQTNSRLDEIEQSVTAHTTSLEKLEAMQTTLETQLKENDDKTLLALKHEIMLTRALDTLARGRLYLAQSNFGLAKEDVQSARDLLTESQAGSSDVVIAEAITRLDVALGNLPEFPVVASGDLEIAWQILMTGKVVATATPVPTSTGTPSPQSTLPSTATATP
jgi:helix-hairpin-helix protein